MGFTHIELLPVTEHPFDGSWGYQPIGMYAPTWRFGEPDDFDTLIDRCHQAGIGVIVDWVPAHFHATHTGWPLRRHRAVRARGSPARRTCRLGHADFNYGRSEVRNYLISKRAVLGRGISHRRLRVDAVASMLYLDYSARAGEWLPNEARRQ